MAVQNQPWGAMEKRYSLVEQTLQKSDLPAQAIVMVNNPPGYFISTNRPAIAIPHGDLETLFAAARRYQARILLLEIDQIAGASDLFANPRSIPGLTYLSSVEQVHIFTFDSP